MSFRYKFVFSFIAIEAFFVVTIVLFNASSLQRQSTDLIERKVATASTLFAETVKTPLLVNDLATIDDAALSFVAIPNIVYVQVDDYQGNMLSQVSNDDPRYHQQSLLDTLRQMAMSDKRPEDVFLLHGYSFLFAKEAIVLEGDTVGHVRFIYDLSESVALIEQNSLVSYLLIAVELLISALVAIFLGHKVTNALSNLSRVAHRIAQDKPVKISAYKDGKDEIGRLYQEMQVMQNNINERTEQLTTARHKAMRASKGKSEFLAIMSHEIRTPLNGMMGSLNLINVDKLPEQDGAYITTAKASSEILLTVINDILDYSKIEAGKFSLDQHIICIDALVDAVEDFYRSLIEQKGLAFIVKRINIEQVYIRGDEIRIKQIINNYMNNAIKFTEKGTITLVIEKSVETLHFSVTDTGIGIHQEDISQLFTDFAQLNIGANRQFGGTGLGLAISKKLALLMNGDVSIDSQYGKGSTFSVSLQCPFVSKAAFEKENKQLASKEEELKNNLNATVLLVEDNRTNQMIATKLLEKVGCTVIIANNGVESLEALKHDEFDIILMDCQMPIMDGFEASNNIRKSGNSIPIIALTANAQESDRQACLQAGMSDFLSKPFKPKQLYQKVWQNMQTTDKKDKVSCCV